jgi:hypothetical protein
LTVVGLQQSAKAFDTDDVALRVLVLWLDDSLEALVNPLVMVVREVLGQDVAQLLFRREDEVIEAFLFDSGVRGERHKESDFPTNIRPSRIVFPGGAAEIARTPKVR